VKRGGEGGPTAECGDKKKHRQGGTSDKDMPAKREPKMVIFGEPGEIKSGKRRGKKCWWDGAKSDVDYWGEGK